MQSDMRGAEASRTDPAENLNCRYCAGFLAQHASEKDALWNRILLQSENFVVTPSLGHFVPGWVLIISKLHYRCVGELEQSLFSELAYVRRQARLLLHRLYGPLIEFEHGPCGYTGANSCVQHLHLHIVPLIHQLNPHLAKVFPGTLLKEFSQLQDRYQAHQSYIYCQDATGAMVFNTSVIPSQFMRQLIADKLGMLEKYDWRSYAGNSELNSFLREVGKGTEKE